ncbi:MAG TPA: hypothetical protein VD970_18610 [Acetobacteraceae bacterium]|nr:hypothetical protein [Acetobacteraceae bacterium]
MANRTLVIASLAAAALSAGAAFLAADRAHSHHGHAHDGHGHHHHHHAHVQESGGKPRPAGAPARQYVDSGRCPSGSAFNVINRGQAPIVQVFLRPSGTTGGFEEERLRGRVLNPGQWIELDPGIGRYDVLVLRADGVGITALRQDPCRISEVALRADASVAIR